MSSQNGKKPAPRKDMFEKVCGIAEKKVGGAPPPKPAPPPVARDKKKSSFGRKPKVVAKKDEPSLIDRIKETHGDVEAAFGRGVERARDVGLLLLEAKEEQGHGNWEKWFTDANFAFSARTARAYMRLAENWDAIVSKTADSAVLTVEAALGLISERKVVEEVMPKIEKSGTTTLAAPDAPPAPQPAKQSTPKKAPPPPPDEEEEEEAPAPVTVRSAAPVTTPAQAPLDGDTMAVDYVKPLIRKMSAAAFNTLMDWCHAGRP